MFDRLLLENGHQMNKIGNKVPLNPYGLNRRIIPEYYRLAGTYLNAPVQVKGRNWVVKERYRIRDKDTKKAKKISRAIIETEWQAQQKKKENNKKNGVGGHEENPGVLKSLGFINHVLELLQEWWAEKQGQHDGDDDEDDVGNNTSQQQK
jgi:hypothetical protein